MTGNTARLVHFGAGLLGLATLGWVLTGQAAGPAQKGFPTDWTHHHLIFSRPATAQQAARVEGDPRFLQQWYRQNFVRVLTPDTADSGEMSLLQGVVHRDRKLHSDWTYDLGSGGSVGAGNYPAKYSFGITTANCGSATTPDYVVFSTGLAGAPGPTTGQASIVGFDNLYSGCGGTVPSVYWAYNTGGTIMTSPAISEDGTQVAFVETNGGFGILVLLKWAKSTTESVTSPMTLTAVYNSSYRSCTAPCMTEVLLKDNMGNQTNDTTSSVFPDYFDDTIWVGGALGWLHKITGVFRGTPGEVTTGGYPVQVYAATLWLSSPVYDRTSGYVFVGDSGGYLYQVTNASPPVVTQSGKIDYGVGIVAGPMVDVTAEKIYVFSSDDDTTNCNTGTDPCYGVFQFAPNFAAGSMGSGEAAVGASSATNPLYGGGVDSAYQATDATGALYVCGGGTGGANPTVWRVPITAGAFGTPILPLAALTGNRKSPACSPVTDIPNPNATGGAAERIFFSVADNSHPSVCLTAGCGESLVDMPWQPSTPYKVGQEILTVGPDNKELWINVAITTGTSGTSVRWTNTIGAVTSDGVVTWLNQGNPTVTALGAWPKSNTYTVAARIIDSNGNVEVETAGGTTGTTEPTNWATTAGGTTTDNTVTWTNAGILPSDAISTAGGTSGIIMDNVVGSGTLTGASQVYGSTLSNQACTAGPGGTGGCAIQASQETLQ